VYDACVRIFYAKCRFYKQDIDDIAGAALSKELETQKKDHTNYGTFDYVRVDAGSGKDCEKLVSTAIEKYGRIDVLFNNVGIQPKESGVPIHELDEKFWDLIMDVNLKVNILHSNPFYPLHRAHFGCASTLYLT
jgi:NAD(P)-dependent dehydrogenase (short-subunit alcohol dehydrogenase family)